MNAIAPVQTQIIQVELPDLADSPFQKKRVSDRGNVDELAASMREVGVLEPLLVRLNSKLGAATYETVAGHRRKRGAALAELKTVPCMVGEYTDDQVLEIQTVENSQRADVHPLDEADNFAELVKRGRTTAQIAERIGRPSAYVVKRLQLCELAPDCRKALDEDRITLGVAEMIARIPDRQLQADALRAVGSNEHAHALPAKRAGEVIRDRFMLRLADAPFDRGDAELVKKAGACMACPKRSGNALELFADVDSPDVCTDPTCYRSKLDAHWTKVNAAAKDNGTKVLADSTAKKVFSPQGGERTAHDSEWIGLDEEHYSAATGRNTKVRAALKGLDVEPTLARNPHTGKIHELVPRKAYDAAVAKAKRANDTARSSSSGSKKKGKAGAEDKAQRERDALKAEITDRAKQHLTVEIGDKVEKSGAKADLAVFRLIAPWVAANAYEGRDEALKRRGLNFTKFNGWAAKASESALRSFIAEALVGDMFSLYGAPSKDDEREVDALCKLIGVDRAAITKHAAEVVTAEKSKPADGAKPKTAAKPAKVKPAKASKKKAKR